ncbi:MAG: DNA translocase FtsK 4TM domain-containing protein [Anaerolineaceae bacterium]|nr:DNA translocase FtsK 4TM domain-containing protein [Anaerolineaceae bacterium]
MASKTSRATKKTKKPITSKRSTRTPSSRKSRAQRTHGLLGQPLTALREMPQDRKLDLTGLVLVTFGAISTLALISYPLGWFALWWVNLLGNLVGWGVYPLALGSVILGIWVLLRNKTFVPQLSTQRVIGGALLSFNLLAWFHLFAGGTREIIPGGDGGGFIGFWVLDSLLSMFGDAGAIIVMLVWFLLGLILALSISINQMANWLGSGIGAIGNNLPHPDRRAGLPAIKQAEDDGFTRLADIHDTLVSPDEIENTYLHPQKPRAAYTASSAPLISVPQSDSIRRSWVLPKMEAILEGGIQARDSNELNQQRSRIIEETLASFGVPAHVVSIQNGPAITQFGVEPDYVETRYGKTRVRVNKIESLADDLALALSSTRIRIEAPVPGHSYVGIEVPNTERGRVALRDVMESDAFKRIKSSLRIALGKDVAGRPVAADMAVLPHLLIAGTTGSGKSVCVNSIISCLLMSHTPDDLRFVLVDPKRVELSGYNGMPHLLAPVIVDANQVVSVLQWMMREMDSRLDLFAQSAVRNIEDYNKQCTLTGSKPLPRLVIIIDELADLIMMAPEETEGAIARIAQMARATGMHMILATQRPSVNVVTGRIKANLPARISFNVFSNADSRVILDQSGAEKLLGKGDMLFQASDAPAPLRLQGAYISDEEISRLVTFWLDQSARIGQADEPQAHTDGFKTDALLKQSPLWKEPAGRLSSDSLYDDAVDLVRREGRASTSMLQRRMRIGYSRAARLIDAMEEAGVIGVARDRTKVREVLDYGPAAPPVGEE